MLPTARDGSPSRKELVAALAAATEEIEHLETALRSRVVIEQAKGVLRERFGWSVDDAFHVLRHAARSSRKRIHEIAERVVASSETPVEITIAVAHSSRIRAAHLHEHVEAQQERTAKLLDQVHALQRSADGHGRFGGTEARS